MGPNTQKTNLCSTDPEQFGSLRQLTCELLKSHGVRARKRLGQNFLVDDSAVEAIIKAAAIEPTDRVLEIGAGLGALTVPLAMAAEAVTAVELDERLTKILVERTRLCTNIQIVRGDFLEIPLDDLVPAGSATRWKVVANLPYYVTSPILERLYAYHDRFDRFVVTVQQEVADRMTAAPGTSEYGSFTVFTQYHTDVKAVRTLPPEAFLPRPKVSSTILCMLVRRRPPVGVPDADLLFRVVRASFSHRRKNLVNSIAAFNGLNLDKSQLQRAILAAGLSPQSRGETLSLEDFARLTRELARRSGGI